MVLMTELPDRALAPLSTPEQVLKSVKPVAKDSRGILLTSEVENGAEERHRKRGKPSGDSHQSLDTESDLSDNRKKAPMRLKAVEQSLAMQSPSDSERKFERSKSQSSQISKSNVQYHKLFQEISKDESLRQSYTCALQKDMLYQGRLFVSDNWICFHSRVFGRDTKVAIPVLSVTVIKKTKTAILVPNALVIATKSGRHVFASFLSRDTTYKLLKSICIHLDGDNTETSTVTSSAENSFRVDCPSSLPLDFSGDYLDLDGVGCRRRQDMLESSSSGSQTPDYQKMTDFSSLPDTFLSGGKSGEMSVHADVHLQNPGQKHAATHQNGLPKPPQGLIHKDKPVPESLSLHTLLLIYLFLVSVLVLSSCYMAFKIVALEHRLNSLGPMAEYSHSENVINHRSQADFNAEIYGELSTNLYKLEKIQRNLRKLLDET